MKKKIFLQGNSVVVEDFVTGDSQYIGIQFFSFETALEGTVNETIQLIDSSKDQEVISILTINCLDQAGAPIGDLADIVTYLQGFSAPAGTVTLEAGSQVEIVDDALRSMSIGNFQGNEATKGFFLMAEDQNGFAHRVRCEEDGRLISSASVVNPPTSTPIVEAYQGNVLTTVDDDYLIPNGETIVIQNLSGGAEGDVDGSKVELFVFPDGTKTGGELLSVLYVNGSNGSDGINQGFTGDGSKLVTIRRSRLAGAGKEIFGKWIGYKY
jgi:hypothetical protein